MIGWKGVVWTPWTPPLHPPLYIITITCEHLPVFAEIINNKINNRGNKKTFSNEKVGGIGKGGVKRKGTRFWEMKNETKILSLGSVTFTCAIYRIFVSLFFSQNLVPSLFTPPLPPIPVSHQLSR